MSTEMATWPAVAMRLAGIVTLIWVELTFVAVICVEPQATWFQFEEKLVPLMVRVKAGLPEATEVWLRDVIVGCAG